MKDKLFYAGIEPDYNVLPLITPHFKSRYANQSWLIYDLKRKYGIHYDCITEQVAEVMLEWKVTDKINPGADVLMENEEKYAELWKDYFKSTGIPERKNMKLHIQHVPCRYWKYLTEKQVS